MNREDTTESPRQYLILRISKLIILMYFIGIPTTVYSETHQLPAVEVYKRVAGKTPFIERENYAIFQERGDAWYIFGAHQEQQDERDINTKKWKNNSLPYEILIVSRP